MKQTTACGQAHRVSHERERERQCKNETVSQHSLRPRYLQGKKSKKTLFHLFSLCLSLSLSVPTFQKMAKTHFQIIFPAVIAQEFLWMIAGLLIHDACEADLFRCDSKFENAWNITIAATIMSMIAACLMYFQHCCFDVHSTIGGYITHLCVLVWFVTFILGIASASLVTDFFTSGIESTDSDAENKFKAGWWFGYGTQIVPRILSFVIVQPYIQFFGYGEEIQSSSSSSTKSSSSSESVLHDPMADYS